MYYYNKASVAAVHTIVSRRVKAWTGRVYTLYRDREVLETTSLEKDSIISRTTWSTYAH